MLNRRAFMVAAMAAAAGGRGAAGATPSARGFFAPAEEAPHARTWLCWPSTPAIYGGAGAYYEELQETIGRLAAAIAEHEPVTMLAAQEHHARAAEVCGPKVALLDIATDDMWARDSGPVFLVDGKGGLALSDFNFNGWGNKQDHARDGKVAAGIARHLGCPTFRAPVTGEGGGLEFDGEGTLLLTDSCWVNDNRNPGLTRAEIEAALKASLGVVKVIWLPGVRGQEETDGHIDGSIRFVRPGLVVTSGLSDDRSDWGLVLEESRAILARETDARGRPFELAQIASALEARSTHHRFFTSYANFYVGNGAVYTPEFGDASADRLAAETLGQLFPGRQVVALNVDRIYENGGGIHCVTQQQPAV